MKMQCKNLSTHCIGIPDLPIPSHIQRHNRQSSYYTVLFHPDNDTWNHNRDQTETNHCLQVYIFHRLKFKMIHSMTVYGNRNYLGHVRKKCVFEHMTSISKWLHKIEHTTLMLIMHFAVQLALCTCIWNVWLKCLLIMKNKYRHM
jgi:hypothetical protein